MSETSKCVSEDGKHVSENENIFKGDLIYIIPAALGQNRLSLFKKQVLRHGGQLLDSWTNDEHQGGDRPSRMRRSEVTHVVADDSLTEDRLRQILNPATNDEDFCRNNVHYVKTSWISECLRQKRRVNIESYLFEISPDFRTASDHRSCKETTDNLSIGEDGQHETVRITNKTPEIMSKLKVNPAKFACSAPSTSQSINHNRHITEKLEALADTYKATKDRWRATGYEKAISALTHHHKEITTWEEARLLPAIGDRLADKIWEIVETGRLRKMEEVCSNETVSTIKLFSNVWGIGQTTAQALVQQGHRTLEDLKTANLNRQQVIGLRHYHDFLDRMSREEASEIETTVRMACLELDQGLEVVACGSYRRKKETCGDVDVLVTHPDGRSHKGLLHRILASLRQTGFLTSDLVAHEQNGNQHKYLGVCKLPKPGSLYRRLDIIVVPYSEFACSLLYFTGSAHFNRSMRLLARKMGMSLSEHSLNKGVIRKGQERLCEGILLETPTEQSVFEHLGLNYRPPEERDY